MSDTATVPLAPAPPKSWAQRFVDNAVGSIQAAKPADAIGYLKSAGSVTGNVLQGGTVGLLLGAAHARWGLDTSGGPVDGWLTGIGWAGAVALSQVAPWWSSRFEHLAEVSAGIWGFRNSFGWCGGKAGAGRVSFAGESSAPRAGETPPRCAEEPDIDPIVAIASSL